MTRAGAMVTSARRTAMYASTGQRTGRMAMAEYIDRQTVIDTLDGLCDIVCQYSKKRRAFMCGACNLGSAFDVLQELPAADVRPVVLCKDCMHWEYDAIFADGWCRGRQQGNPNWYCADGEKREES